MGKAPIVILDSYHFEEDVYPKKEIKSMTNKEYRDNFIFMKEIIKQKNEENERNYEKIKHLIIKC